MAFVRPALFKGRHFQGPHHCAVCAGIELLPRAVAAYGKRGCDALLDLFSEAQHHARLA